MTEVKTVLRLSSLSLFEINLILSRIGDRLDQIEGYRGNPTFKDDATFEEATIKYTDSNGTVLHSMGGE